MKTAVFCCFVLSMLASVALSVEANPAGSQSRKLKTREFKFNYSAKLTSLSKGSHVRVWFPVPQTNQSQTIGEQSFTTPSQIEFAVESVYGNKMGYFETTVDEFGPLKFNCSYDVQRSEIRALDGAEGSDHHTKLTKDEYDLYLSSNKRVPVDGKPTSLLDKLTFSSDTIDIARKLYDRVDSHVTYDKSNPGYGNGDVLWVCDSQFGNCTDFHSLFISFARSKGIPARFEIGFPLPPKRGKGKIGGYHCWGLFYSNDHGWVPVDISEADKHPEMKEYYFGNITENRVTFSTGRDIDLVPKQEGPALNYFVYPYAEVDGVPLPKKQIEIEFTYADK